MGTKYKTKEEATEEYIAYIDEHIRNVSRVWLEVMPSWKKCLEELGLIYRCLRGISVHDRSKKEETEFEPYRQWFFPSEEDAGKDKKLFDKAWKHHYQNNPHHWEYWRSEKGPERMALPALLEMLCDWSAVSLKFGDTPSAFYNKKGATMDVHPETRDTVEKLLPVFDAAVEHLVEEDRSATNKTQA